MRNILLIAGKIFWFDKLSMFLLTAGLIICGISFWLLSSQINSNQTGIVLHYNIHFGIDILQQARFQIYLPLIGGLSVWLLNLLLGSILYGQVNLDQKRTTSQEAEHRKKKKAEDYYLDYFDAKILASYLLWGSGSLLQAIVLIYIISLVIVNS